MMLKQDRISLKCLALAVRRCTLTLLSLALLSLPGQATAKGIKVAFIGDQGTDKNAKAVLSLVASEGTDLLLIQGDLGYLKGSASSWESNLDNALGRDFPVLTVVGNHENFEWPLYQRLIQRRIDRVDELDCTGNTGVKVTCRFANLEIVHVAPGIYEVEGVAAIDDYAGYIREAFRQPSANWRICGWHKNQNKLQTGRKSDGTGWAVYDACLDAGAMVALAHEHAYSRTHLLGNFEKQRVVHTGSDMTLRPGQSFAFVSGLGGYSVREQKRDGDWWASVYTASQGATHGALFCTFNDFTADCYFKAVDGSVPDRFSLRLGPNAAGAIVQASQNPAPPAPAPAVDDSKPANSSGLPERPANLHADIYSNTSFELFWDRVPDAILEYEVKVDGKFDELTDGTSWYARGLEAGRRYVVDVVAIDIFGNRSPASTVVVSEGGNVKPSASSSSSSASNSGSQGGNVNSPQNAWIDVYSKTAAELFWDRPAAEKRIVNTQVLRDGVLIGETDGTSFFDDGRIRGKSYRYELIAINASGNASSSTVVSE